MRLALLFALIPLTALGQGRFDRFCDRSDQGRSQRGLLCDSGPFFEAFPANGAGTTTACSTTAPTGARGEVLTFTRASSATCTKTAAGGLATTGIANGDLVVLSSNVARAMYSSDGVLGLLVESARTNVVPRSEEFDNASWLKLNNVVVAPTVTANTTISPDGATTADTVAYPQVVGAGAQSSVAYQFSATAAPWTCSVYVRSPASSSGRIYVSATVTGAAFPMSAACDHVSTSWTRCTATATLTAALYYLQIGIDLRDAAQATQAAQSVYMYGAGCEEGAYATSYVPTVAAAVTRAAESSSFTIPSTGPTACIAASVTWPSANVGAVNYASLGSLGTANMTLQRTSNTAAGFRINAITTAPVVAAMGTTTHRGLLYDNAGTRAAFWDAVSVAAPAATMAAGGTDVWIGRDSAGAHADGIVSRVQVDPSPLRCTQ